ncbi:MAG: cytochrome c biogenesis protein CcsA [Fimbriimonadaceae bacterium]|nr:cytochrome c biogenesis protein CcsA [Fimbriimonadaceae bacterium]
MSRLSAPLKWLLMLAMAAMTVYYFAVPPAQSFKEPDLARVVIFHLPCAFTCTVYFLYASFCSGCFLAKRDLLWEHRAAAATAASLTTACATMATGILFSKVQWGEWWHWDARQTSFLIVLLLLGAYFLVRIAFDEPVMRARAAAAYSVITALPIVFLTFVLPRIPQVAATSLHPSDTVQQGKFSPEYWTGVLGVFTLVMLFTTWVYRTHVHVAVLEEKDTFDDGPHKASDGRAPASGVVRPVRPHE